MKIITWNCNGAFRKKFHLIENLGADIVVIQECEDPSKAGGEYQEWAHNHLWIGANKNKGLGVFAKKHIDLKRLDWNDDGLQLFLPCRVNEGFNLVAVWTKQANSPNFRYIGQFWKYLQLNKNEMASKPSLICGDFNSNVCWDEWDRWWNHSDVVRELDEIGIHSLYHEAMKEAQGKESTPTLYMHRKLEKPYHIDYAFISKQLSGSNSSIEIGKHEFWIDHSDHMPLIFTMPSVVR
jgi:exonuclease III